MLTFLVQAQGALDALAGFDDGALDADDGCIVDKLSTIAQRADSSQEREQDEEQQERLCLCQWNARLDVKLRQRSLPRQCFAQNGGLIKHPQPKPLINHYKAEPVQVNRTFFE